MKIRDEILRKHLVQAAIEQISSEYDSKGYAVKNNIKIDGLFIDLLVENEKEKIIFEFKSGLWDNEKREIVKSLRNKVVHELNAQFKLILVNLPEKNEIEVEGFEELLFEKLPEYFVDELSQLSTHTSLEEIADLNYSYVLINEEGINLVGNAIMSLELQFGSNSDLKRDDGFISYESMYFSFNVELTNDLAFKDFNSLELDED